MFLAEPCWGNASRGSWVLPPALASGHWVSKITIWVRSMAVCRSSQPLEEQRATMATRNRCQSPEERALMVLRNHCQTLEEQRVPLAARNHRQPLEELRTSRRRLPPVGNPMAQQILAWMLVVTCAR